MSEDLHSKVHLCEKIGVVGSPSSNTAIAVDVTEEAYQKGLVGNFCTMEFTQDGSYVYPIGQVVSIVLKNPYLERHSIRKIVSVRGEASPLTERHDVRMVEMAVGSSFSSNNGKLEPIIIGSVPPTGTHIYLLDQGVIDSITEDYLSEISVVGKMYNTDINLPMIFRNFGDVYPGLGESYHIGIFGKTGSGKSYLARMILLSYARNEPMSIILIDPQGEYAKEIRNSGTLKRSLDNIGRSFELVDVSNIALTKLNSLKRILHVSNFLEDMGVKAEENKENAADLIASFFAEHRPITTVTGEKIVCTLENSSKKNVFNALMNYVKERIERIYVTPDPQRRVLTRIDEDKDILYFLWSRISNLFATRGKIWIDDILERVTREKQILIIDLSETSAAGLYWDDKVQSIVIKDIIKSLEEQGSKLFRQGKSFNLLVVTDEAHRLIPRERPEDEDFRALKNVFVDSVRTTRKYGLGWMFISQSLASLEYEILRQLRLYFFGYGLSWGGERRVLEELLGRGSHIQLYQSFRDPQTSAIYGKKEYPFMVYGPISPLSSSGAPLFLTALDYNEEFPILNKMN
jgi:DNA helicase HerA-like ATPase